MKRQKLFGRYKFSININQKGWLNVCEKIDPMTAIIFDVIQSFCACRSDKVKNLIKENEEYVWLNYGMIIKELPIFGIKSKATIGRHIEKLKKIGLIKIFQSPEGSIYVRMNEKARDILFEQSVPQTEQPLFQERNSPVPQTEQHNQITIQSDNNTISADKKSAQGHKDFIELKDFYIIGYKTKIKNEDPVWSWGQCEKLARPHLAKLGLPRLKVLLNAYFASDDRLFKENAWSFSCFLSTKILHRLNATN